MKCLVGVPGLEPARADDPPPPLSVAPKEESGRKWNVESLQMAKHRLMALSS